MFNERLKKILLLQLKLKREKTSYSFINVEILNFEIMYLTIRHFEKQYNLPIRLSVPSEHADARSNEHYLPGVFLDQHNGVYAYT